LQQKNWREGEPRLTKETAARLDAFFSSFRRAANFTLLLDYDGTLAPFRVNRFHARPWTGVRELLTQIQKQTPTRLVIVTGRPAAEIVPLLAIKPAPEIWGLHGAERLFPGGRRELEQIPAATHAALRTLCAQLQRDAFGGLIEQKPNAIVMHWRGVAPRKARIIEQRTRALFEPLTRKNGLSLLVFEAGLELRTGRDKGGAVRTILEESSNEGAGPIAYLGDDLTDESAFRAIKSRGLGVLVRRQARETSAGIWLRPPGELRDFLARWLASSTRFNMKPA